MGSYLLLETYLKRLRLPTLARNYRRFVQEATHGNQPYERNLLALLETQVHHQEASSERKRLVQARFPVLKTLDEFQFAAIPGLNRQAIPELAQGNYIQAKENAVWAPPAPARPIWRSPWAWPPGVQGNRVRLATAAGLINELMEAQAQLRLSKLEAALLKLDLFVKTPRQPGARWG